MKKPSPVCLLSKLLPATLVFLAVSSTSRAGDVGPTVPAGDGTQVLWLAADFGVTPAGGGALTSWLDASGNGFDWLAGGGSNNGGVTVSSGDTLPAANGINNVPLIAFNGQNAGGLGLNIVGRKLDLTQFSVYVVGNTTVPDPANSSQDFITNFHGTNVQPNGNNNGFAIGPSDNNANNAKFYTGQDSTNLNSTGNGFANQQFALLADTIDAATNKTSSVFTGIGSPSTTFLAGPGNANNLDVGGASASTSYTLGELGSYGAQNLKGNIAEVLVYDDTGLTDAQIQDQENAVGSYLAAKYLEAPVPEPASFGLLALGALGFLSRRRRA